MNGKTAKLLLKYANKFGGEETITFLKNLKREWKNLPWNKRHEKRQQLRSRIRETT